MGATRRAAGGIDAEADLFAHVLLRRRLALRHLDVVDAVEHADHRLLHGVEHGGGLLVALAPFVDEVLEQLADGAHFAAGGVVAVVLGVALAEVGEAGGDALGGGICKLGEAGVGGIAAGLEAAGDLLDGGRDQRLEVGPGGSAAACQDVVEARVGEAIDDRRQRLLDAVEAAELRAGLVELLGQLGDVRFEDAQAFDIGALGDAVERGAEALLELIEAIAERRERGVGGTVGEARLDALRDVGEALLEPAALDVEPARLLLLRLLGGGGSAAQLLALRGRGRAGIADGVGLVMACERFRGLVVPGVLVVRHDRIEIIER